MTFGGYSAKIVAMQDQFLTLKHDTCARLIFIICMVLGLHYAGVDSQMKQKAIASFVAFLFLVLLPYLHIGKSTFRKSSFHISKW